MTATEVQPDVEHLDFNPKCGFTLIQFGVEHHRCPREARWVAVLPCCTHPVSACNEHRNINDGLPFECSACGHLWPCTPYPFNWIRI